MRTCGAYLKSVLLTCESQIQCAFWRVSDNVAHDAQMLLSLNSSFWAQLAVLPTWAMQMINDEDRLTGEHEKRPENNEKKREFFIENANEFISILK